MVVYLTDRNSWPTHSMEFAKAVYTLMFILSSRSILLVLLMVKASLTGKEEWGSEIRQAVLRSMACVSQVVS